MSSTHEPLHSVRAKFKVQDITKHLYGNKLMYTVHMTPVYSQTEGSENKAFWDASPSGDLKLGTINERAAEYFVVGEEYYLDFTRTSKDQAT